MEFLKTWAGFKEISLSEGVKNINDKYENEIRKQKYKENNEFIYNFFKNNSDLQFTKEEIKNMLVNTSGNSYVIEYMLKNHPEELKKYFCKNIDHEFICIYN